jgi:hypothetical protein
MRTYNTEFCNLRFPDPVNTDFLNGNGTKFQVVAGRKCFHGYSTIL